jgi:AcrR family transcriptional regulator
MSDETLSRERILDVAEEVFRRYGPARATVIDVVRALGVSHGSVYRHFASKAELRDAVTERWLARSSANLPEIVAQKNALAGARLYDWLWTVMKSKRELAAGDPELFALYMALTTESREVVLDTQLTGRGKMPRPGAPEIIGFEARTQINRKDFGLNWNVALETGGFLVSDLIKIEIVVEAHKQS